MPEIVRVTFLYAMGQKVRWATGPEVYTIVSRTYTEREIMGPVVTYRLARQGLMLPSIYEPDIVPLEEDD